VINEGQS